MLRASLGMTKYSDRQQAGRLWAKGQAGRLRSQLVEKVKTLLAKTRTRAEGF